MLIASGRIAHHNNEMTSSWTKKRESASWKKTFSQWCDNYERRIPPWRERQMMRRVCMWPSATRKNEWNVQLAAFRRMWTQPLLLASKAIHSTNSSLSYQTTVESLGWQSSTIFGTQKNPMLDGKLTGIVLPTCYRGQSNEITSMDGQQPRNTVAEANRR